MSEWKKAKQLAEDLGCSTSAVFVAISKNHRLRGRLIEKKKEGSSAFFRVVPEPTEYAVQPKQARDSEPKHKWPKPPLTIVEEDAVDRLSLIETRLETLSKVAWDAGRNERSALLRDIERRVEAVELSMSKSPDERLSNEGCDIAASVESSVLLAMKEDSRSLISGHVGRINDLEAQIITLKSEVQDLQSQLDQLSLRKLVLRRSK